MKKKRFLVIILLVFGVFLGSQRAFAFDIQPSQTISNGYYTLQTSAGNNNWIRQMASFDFQSGDFTQISLIMSASVSSNVSINGTCQYEGASQFTASVNVSTLGVYTFTASGMNHHCYDSYWWITNNSTNNVRIYGNTASVSGVYLETYSTSPLTTPIQVLAYAVNNPTALNLTTNVTISAPTNGSTTTSTSVAVNASYYLTDPDLGNYPSFPVVIVASLHRTDAPADPLSYSFTAIANTPTSITHTFTLPTNTTWQLTLDLSGDGYYFISPLTSPVNFNVVTNPAGGGDTGYTTCSITDLAGCFQNAIVYLFYPSQTSLSQFTEVMNTIKTKPPIGYISGIITAIGSFDLNATPTLTFATFTPLNTYVFTPFRTGLVWVLWVIFAFLLFKRFQQFDL